MRRPVWPDVETASIQAGKAGRMNVVVKARGRTRFGLTHVVRVLVSPATLVGLVVIGALLRIAVYSADRSLVSDEPFIVLNVERFSASRLTGELDWNQAAPIGFLELEKGLTSAFGSSEYVIRLAPFVAALAAVVLFAWLATRVLRSYAVPLAVLVFLGIALDTSYAAVAKPYAFDVLVVLALYLSTLGALRNERTARPLALLGILGVVAPLLSYASVFAIAASATVIAADAALSRSRRRIAEVSAVVGTWLALLLVVFVARGDTLSHLRRSFPYETVSSVGSLRNLAGNLREALGLVPHSNYLGYSNGLGATVSVVASVCAGLFIAVGALRLLARHWRIGALVLLPGIFVLLASAVGWYPIFPRALLFLTPTLAILAAEGFRALFRWNGSAAARSGVLALLALVIVAEAASTVRGVQSVRPDDGMRPVMNILAERQRRSDTVYLDFASQYAFAHYLACRCAGAEANRAEREGLWNVVQIPGGTAQWAPALKTQTPRFRIGNFRRYGVHGYYDDFARFARQGRVWVILSALSGEQREALTRRLDSRGRRLFAHNSDGSVTAVSLLLYAF
jgi:hypothetical protein